MTVTFSVLGVGVAIPVSGLTIFGYRRFRRTKADELESFWGYLGRGFQYYVGRHLRRQIAAELTLKEYARNQLKSTATDTMLVPAIIPVQLRVDKMFIPLLLRGAANDTSEYQTLTERSGARIVILGDPGSGKSSLMKRVFRDACWRAKADPRHSPLPVIFELRKLSQLGVSELSQLTHLQLLERCMEGLDEMAAFDAEHAVESLKSGPGYLLLLDGLDEVPSDASTQVATAIAELARHLSLSSPSSSLIVSTRTQHYLTLRGHPVCEIFRALSIRPFSIADVYKFLLRWPFEEGENRKEQITRLFSRIGQLPSLTEMCTNPLALSMFVARDQQTGGLISPETRSQFYAALVAELIVNRRLRREDEEVGRQRLGNVRESVLGAVCLGHLLDPDEALNSLGEARFLDAMQVAGYGTEDPHEALLALASKTGLFATEREGETYRFQHLTLCEFLAAKELVNEGPEGWRQIAGRLREDDSGGDRGAAWASRLGEVVAFACGLAPRSLQREILEDLVSLDDRGLLLKASIEAQRYDDRHVLAAIREEAERLAGIGPDRWEVDADWFPRLRSLIAVLRDILAGARSELGEAAGETMPSPSEYLLRLIDAHGAADVLLATLARNDANAAIAIAEDSARPELMDVIAGAADDFNVLTGILARCDKGQDAWKQALIHAALHQREIANVITIPIDRPGTDLPTRGWSGCFITQNSVYGQLLDEVLAAPDAWQPTDRALLETIARIEPPRPGLAVIRGRTIESPAPMLAVIAVPVFTMVSFFLKINELELIALGLTVLLVVVLCIPVALVMWIRRRRQRRSQDLALTLQVKVGVVSLTLDQPTARTKREASRGSNTAKLSHSENLKRFWREPVLEEILNLEEFHFAGTDSTDPTRWEPRRIQRLLGGVPETDLTALRLARALRRDALDESTRSSIREEALS